MNAKKVKALRKALRNMLKSHTGDPVADHEFQTVRNSQKTIVVEDPREDGSMGVKKVEVFGGQKVVAPRSKRAVYLQLKKEVNKIK